MKIKEKLLILLLIVILCTFSVFCLSCSFERIPAVNILEGKDSNPPILIGAKASGKKLLMLIFDEQINLIINKEKDKIESITYKGNIAYISLKQTLEPWEKITLDFIAMDLRKNTTSLICPIYGFNARKPLALINEFTTKGTKTQPDRTELIILKGGNLAGLTLYQGCKEDWDTRVILPNKEVNNGDFIVIWWTEELPPGIDNTKNICAETSETPPSLNGCESLYSNPSELSTCLDAVIYANHSGVAYNKFGNKENEARASLIVNQGNWKSDEENLTGLSGVNSLKTTSTRSIARWKDKIDSNTNKDWYITKTSGETFGKENTSEAFVY